MPLVAVILPEITGSLTGPLICNETEPTRSARLFLTTSALRPSTLKSLNSAARVNFQFAAFFNRFLTPEVNQIGELDVFGVFSATHIDDAANKLLARSASDFKIEIGSGAEVFRKRHGHVVAVNVEQETRNSEAIKQRASGGGNTAAAHGAGQRINLRLV